MKLRSGISYIIGRTLGSLSFIRIIEWREILRSLHPQNDERILDIACGDGALTLKIAKRGCQTHGIDISISSIKRAKSVAGKRACDFLIADAELLPYASESFDKIVCSSSLEHFRNDVRALKEMNRVLKTNGTVVITTDSSSYPMEENLRMKHRTQYHVINYYDLDKIFEKFEQSDFQLLSSKYLLNSVLTSFFYRLVTKTYGKFYRQLLVLLLGDFLTPLFLICDKLAGKKSCGYTLLVKAEKISVPKLRREG